MISSQENSAPFHSFQHYMHIPNKQLMEGKTKEIRTHKILKEEEENEQYFKSR